jgi:hypothetical protein
MTEHLILIEDKPGRNFNQSRLQAFLDCHRLFFWTYCEKLIPQAPRWPLLVGTATHTGLAELSAGNSVEAALAAALAKFRSELPARRLPGEDVIIAGHEATIQRLIPAYVEHWGDDLAYTPLGIEAAGRVEVGKDSGIFLVFRIDKLVSWNKQTWILDHKTAGRLDMRDMMKYEMDLQMSAYVYGTSVVLNRPVAGIIVDLLVKTQTPQFHRELFTRSQGALAEFEREFVEIVENITGCTTRVYDRGEDPMTVFYKNTKHCIQYGTCPYRGLCLSDTSAQRSLMQPRPPDYVDDLRLLPTAVENPTND